MSVVCDCAHNKYVCDTRTRIYVVDVNDTFSEGTNRNPKDPLLDINGENDRCVSFIPNRTNFKLDS